jgi:hypothetical protein
LRLTQNHFHSSRAVDPLEDNEDTSEQEDLSIISCQELSSTFVSHPHWHCYYLTYIFFQGAVISMAHLWQHNFKAKDTLQPGRMVSHAVLDLYLLSMWYDLEIHQSTYAIYLDSKTADAWEHDVDVAAMVSLYQHHYFLPATGPCEQKVVIFMADKPDGILFCFMDISRRMLHMLAAEGEDDVDWEEWHLITMNIYASFMTGRAGTPQQYK